MLTKTQILATLSSELPYLKSTYHVRQIGLFGSFSRGDQQEASDIDFVIEMEKNTPNLYELKANLRSYLQSKFNRNIDLARAKYLHPYAKLAILAEVEYAK